MEQKLPKGMVATPPYFVSHTSIHGGLLPADPRAHACWYYCRAAIGALKRVDEGAYLEGERDPINFLNNLARSVAMLYRLDDPGEFLKFMPDVMTEAIRCQLEWDVRIEKPWIERFHQN